MPLTVLPCEQCGEDARGFSVKHPNPDVIWCDKCRQQIGPAFLKHHFCSWDCLIKWVETYHRDLEELRKALEAEG